MEERRSMEKIISAKGIRKGFPVAGGDTFWALKGLDLEIARGQLAILKGRSGSGKTTLMNILSALDYPTEGEVFLQGSNIVEMSEKERGLLRRRKIGFVFQSVALVPMMTAYENVEFALRLAKYKGSRREKRSRQKRVFVSPVYSLESCSISRERLLSNCTSAITFAAAWDTMIWPLSSWYTPRTITSPSLTV